MWTNQGHEELSCKTSLFNAATWWYHIYLKIHKCTSQDIELTFGIPWRLSYDRVCVLRPNNVWCKGVLSTYTNVYHDIQFGIRYSDVTYIV